MVNKMRVALLLLYLLAFNNILAEELNDKGLVVHSYLESLNFSELNTEEVVLLNLPKTPMRSNTIVLWYKGAYKINIDYYVKISLDQKSDKIFIDTFCFLKNDAIRKMFYQDQKELKTRLITFYDTYIQSKK